MTITLAFDKGRATRTHSLKGQTVPSQDVSRFKAVEPIHEIRPSIVFRLTDYWHSHNWPIVVGLVLACAAVAWGLVRAMMHKGL